MPKLRRRPLPVNGNQHSVTEIEQWRQDSERLRRISQVMVVIDNGQHAVAYNQCGACGRHITDCGCTTGPVPPVYIQRWVEQNLSKVPS